MGKNGIEAVETYISACKGDAGDKLRDNVTRRSRHRNLSSSAIRPFSVCSGDLSNS